MEEPTRRRRAENSPPVDKAPRQSAQIHMIEDDRKPQPGPPIHAKSPCEMYGHACRRCINMRFSIHLEPKNVKYIIQDNQAIMDRCIYCGRIGHIVSGVKLSGWMKLLMRSR